MNTNLSATRALAIVVIAVFAVAGAFATGRVETTPDPATSGPSVVRGSEWNEAPMLHQRVLAGELPPLEDRLPTEPMVEEVYEEIGVYGGEWR